MRCTTLAVFAAALWSVVLFGCGSTEHAYPVAHLTGTVTVDGQPIADGRIQFIPGDGQKALPAAVDLIDGRYDCDSVPQGKVTVLLRATKEVGPEVAIYGRKTRKRIDLVPPEYRDGIPLVVAEDNLSQDFVLDSKGSAKTP